MLVIGERAKLRIMFTFVTCTRELGKSSEQHIGIFTKLNNKFHWKHTTAMIKYISLYVIPVETRIKFVKGKYLSKVI